jgi:signal transduction histidine kinase/ligand-binding sensor domain-containing protein
MRRHVSIFLLFFLISLVARSSDYEVSFYTRHQGLPQDYVYSLMQDKKHYLWVGTGSGLAKFDGNNFLSFKTTNGLREDFITSSLYLHSGKRLFSHFNGEVTSYFNGKFEVFYKNPSTNESINTMFSNAVGNVWMGTKEGHLVLVDTDKNTHKWLIGEYESVNFIDSVSKDLLLVGSDLHLYLVHSGAHLKNPVSLRITVPDNSGIKNISRLNADSWMVLSQDGNLFLVKEHYKTLSFEPIRFSSPTNGRLVFFQSLANNKCWAVNEVGVWHEFKFSNGMLNLVSTITHPSLIPSLVPNTIYEDNEGNVWLGTFGNGLFKFSIKRSTFYDFDQEKDLKVSSVTTSSNKEIILGTSKGIYVFAKERNQFIKQSGNLASQGIISVCEMEKDNFLIATENSKTYLWNKKTNDWKPWSLPITEQDKIRQLIKDNKGNIWIATSTGAVLSEKSRNRFKIFTMEDGLAHNYVYSIFCDSRGRVWFATHKSGLSYFSGKKIVTIKSPVENSGLDINSFTEDAQGRIWVGTSGQGIFLVDENDKFVKSISSTDGLVSDYIYFFQKDIYGAIWIGHKNGLERILTTPEGGFVISDYSQYVEEKELSQTNYYTNSGMDVWFGGLNTCIRMNINPDNKLPDGSYVDISDLKLNYEEINWSKRRNLKYKDEIPNELSFSYNENLLTFTFNGISFTYNDKLRYQYKLEGFDDKWSLLTEQNFVTYNKLPPGQYTFLVRSRNYAGIWSDSTALHFIITPPYWETWWFRILFLALLFASIYIIIKVRTATLKKRNEILTVEKLKLEKEIKERKIAESKLLKSEIGLKEANQELNTLIYRASHDLRGPVSTIWGLVNVAKMHVVDKESAGFLGMMNTSVEKLDMILKKLFLVSEIKQNEIQPEVFDLKEVLEDVLDTFADEIKARGFKVIIEENTGRGFSTDKRLFEIIVKNIIDNSLTYSRKTDPELRISTEFKLNDLVMKIWDNGKGIRPENIDNVFNMFYKASDLSKGNGLGLYIVKNALNLLGGEIFVKSNENEFTLIQVHIPEYKTTTF